MNRAYLLRIVVLSMLFFLPLPALADEQGALRLARMQGDVQVQSLGMGEWLPAVMNLPLQPKDRLWVPQGAWVQVESRDGSVIRLDAGSSLEILGVEEKALQLYLGSGQGYVNFRNRGDTMLQVDTPVASFRSYDDVVMNVALDDKGNVDLSVFRGEVYAESRSGEVRVEGGKMLTIDDGVPFLMELDSITNWEQRNRDWDKALTAGAENDEYLPPELSVYGRDLSSNGRWVSTPDYGFVWIPTSHISVGWAPYRHGRWVWIGNEYVWIGREPWGWAPYHYGRWSHAPSRGWFWVPPRRHEVYWGPGYVSWIQNSSNIAWVPLAPGEMYYGRGHYGPHSTNIIDINTHTVIPGKDFRNARVRNGVTVIHRDAFLSGKYRGQRGRGNPFLRENIHVGQPGLEPQRTTRMPVVKEIPRDKRPPEAIRSMPGRAGDGPRPTVRGGERPGFQSIPGSQPLAIPVSGARSESGRKPSGELNRHESMRDRRHGPDGPGKPGVPLKNGAMEKDGVQGPGPSAPVPEKSPTPVGAQVAPVPEKSPTPGAPQVAPVPEKSPTPGSPQVAPVPAEEKRGPSGFHGRPQRPDGGDRPDSFRQRPTVNPAPPSTPAAEPTGAQPQAAPAASVPPPSMPVPEQRVREEEKGAPSGFRGRPQRPDDGDRPDSFRQRPPVNPAPPSTPAAEPTAAQPQAAPAAPVPPPSMPVPEQRVREEEKGAPSGFRGRPQSPDDGDRPDSFRQRPSVPSPETRQERASQPVQPQIAPPPSAPAPRPQVVEPPPPPAPRPQVVEPPPPPAPRPQVVEPPPPPAPRPQVIAPPPPAPAPRPQVVEPPPAPAPRPQVVAPPPAPPPQPRPQAAPPPAAPAPPAQIQRSAPPPDGGAGRGHQQRPKGRTDKDKKEEEEKAKIPTP